MDDEKNINFKHLILVCSISIAIELILLFWSNIQVSKLDLIKSNIEAIQFAKKGVMTFFTLLIGTLITSGVSIIIPQIRVWKLYFKIDGHQYHWIATISFCAYIVIPIINILDSICGGFMLIRESGISLFKMISLLLMSII